MLLPVFFLDILDIISDPIMSSEYRKEEDPKLFTSSKTGRGPLNAGWREDYTKDNKGSKVIMTAYKLCKVEFHYWGMQNKIERFIHDVGELRRFSRVFMCGFLFLGLIFTHF